MKLRNPTANHREGNLVVAAARKLIFSALSEKFPQIELKDVANIHNGQSLTSEMRDSSGKIQIYSSGGLVGKHSHGLSNDPFIVIGRKGSAGKVTFAPSGGWVTDTAYFAQPKMPELIDTSYLYHSLAALDFSDDIITTAIPGINRTAIYRHFIPLPSIEIQRDCARFLSALERGDPLPVLPPLPEQQRIVARIKSMLEKVEEARSLAQALKEQQVELLQALAYRADLTTDQKLARGWTHARLSEILQPGALREVVVADKSYPNFGIYSFGKGLFKKPDISGMDTSAQSLYRVKAGQFVYSRLFAFEGSYGLVPDDLDGFYVSNEYPAFDVDRSRATPEFVKAYFLRPGLWPQLAAGSKGLGDRRQRIQPDQILNHELLLPPLDIQERITAVSRLIDTARVESSPSQEQLAALPASILARAYAGEL